MSPYRTPAEMPVEPKATRRRSWAWVNDPVILVTGITISVAAWVACGVSPEQHAKNAGEAVQYGAELADCRKQAREAKKDGGAAAYMAVYEACAEDKDTKHGITITKDGGQ